MARISGPDALAKANNYRSSVSRQTVSIDSLNSSSTNTSNPDPLPSSDEPQDRDEFLRELAEGIGRREREAQMLRDMRREERERQEEKFKAEPLTVDITEGTAYSESANIKSTFEDNILSQYANYTYNIEFFMADPIYQNFGKNVKDAPNKIFIASSKASGKFFINNLNIETRPAIKEQSRMAGIISVDFEITEPRGFSLVDSIVESARQLGIKNHFLAPYYLKLDFVGYDDNGVPIKIMEPVYYSIIIKEFEASTTSEGTIYSVRAYPYDHVGQTNQNFITRTNLRVQAQTIGEFFEEFKTQLNEQSNRIEGNKNVSIYPDLVNFEVDGEIASLPIRETDFVNSPNRNASTEVYVDENLVVNIPRGTGIDAILETLMISNEDWVTSNMIKDPSEVYPQEKKHGIKVWEIDTYTDIGPYDELAGRYSLLINFYIRKFRVLKDAKQRPKYEEDYNDQSYQFDRLNYTFKFLDMKKKYDYIYTGLNTEVLNFDMNFNLIWHQSASLFTKGNYLGPIDQGPQATVPISRVDMATDKLNEVTRKYQVNPSQNPQEQFGNIEGQLFEGVPALEERNQSIRDARQSTLGTDQPTVDDLTNLSQQQSNTRSRRLRSTTNTDRLYVDTILRQKGQAQDLSTAKKQSLNNRKSPIDVSVILDGDRQDVDYQRIIENSYKEYRSVAAALLNNAYGITARDLLKIQIEIRGDPYWLGLSPLEKKGSVNNLRALANNVGFVNYNERDNVFLLNWKFANETINDLGLNSTRNSDMISGVYVVIGATSSFRDGMFIQTLDAIRDIHTNLSIVRDKYE